MNRSIVISSVFHLFIIFLTAMSLPFLAKKPIDLPPIVSVELIQITEKTNIPFAPKAKKIIEKVKEKEKKLVSEQAPPKKVKKIKPDAVPMPEDKVKKVEKIKEDKQNPEKIDNEVKQVSEFEKEELFDPNNIAALIDKSKETTVLVFNFLTFFGGACSDTNFFFFSFNFFFFFFSIIFFALGAKGMFVFSAICINSTETIGGISIGFFAKKEDSLL